jgi:Rrf2 family transcriptional regulator, nitric oxide-sensitive transcriptional repressor
MISQTAEYALRSVVYLAGQTEPKTAQQIAHATHVPIGYLSKVMQGLGRAGLVQSQRGLHGGFSLPSAPEDLTVWEIVNAVDSVQRIRSCPLGLKSHGVHLCPLHRQLDDAYALVENAFRSTTIAHLLEKPAASQPICAFPHAAPSKRSK